MKGFSEMSLLLGQDNRKNGTFSQFSFHQDTPVVEGIKNKGHVPDGRLRMHNGILPGDGGLQRTGAPASDSDRRAPLLHVLVEGLLQ